MASVGGATSPGLASMQQIQQMMHEQSSQKAASPASEQQHPVAAAPVSNHQVVEPAQPPLKTAKAVAPGRIDLHA